MHAQHASSIAFCFEECFARTKEKVEDTRRLCLELSREKSRRAEIQQRIEAALSRQLDQLQHELHAIPACSGLLADFRDIQKVWALHREDDQLFPFERFANRVAQWLLDAEDVLRRQRNISDKLRALFEENDALKQSRFLENRLNDSLEEVRKKNEDSNQVRECLQTAGHIQNELGFALARSLGSTTFNCPICLEDNSEEDVFRMTGCNHKLCRTCAKENVKNALNCGLLPLVCPQCKVEPCAKCPVGRGEGSSHEVERCRISEGDLQLILSYEDFERYQTAMMNVFINRSGGAYIRCERENCSNVINVDPDESHCICNACGYEWCSRCHVEWHEGSTCEQYQEWRKANEEGDENMERLKAEGKVKECPYCHQWGMRGAGECNATHCLHCKNNFCWLCGAGLRHLSDPHAHFNEQGACYGKLFEGVHRG